MNGLIKVLKKYIKIKASLFLLPIPALLFAPFQKSKIAIPVRENYQITIPIERRGNEIIELPKPKPNEPPLPGEINWTKKVIKAKGWGVIDTTNPNKAQAKLMAIGAAKAVAQRNLLEIIKGVRIASETRVQDYMNKSDYIYKRVEGVIRGAKMVGEPIEKNGIIEVEMEVEFFGPDGLIPAIWNSVRPGEAKLYTLSKEDEEQIKEISGVAIDLTDVQQGAPVIFPKIKDEEGNVLFDLAQYYDPNNPDWQKLVKVWNATTEALEETGLYKIKGEKVIGGDIIISKKEAKKVNWLKRTFKALIKLGKVLWILF